MKTALVFTVGAAIGAAIGAYTLARVIEPHIEQLIDIANEALTHKTRCHGHN